MPACLPRSGFALGRRAGAPLRAAAVAAVLGHLAPAAQAQATAGGGSIFVCVTAQKQRLTSDRPIPECMDREQQEIGPGGIVRRRIAPARTDAERAEDEARQKQQDVLKRQKVEAARRDQLLLSRYPTPAQHDAERQSALRRTLEVDALSRQRIATLEKERDGLRRAQSGGNGAAPDRSGALQQQLLSNAGELDAQQRFLAAQESERQRINARFDAELQRLQPLWNAAR